jgi:hypothetical protein
MEREIGRLASRGVLAGALVAALLWAAPARAERLWVATLGGEVVSFDAATGEYRGVFAPDPGGGTGYGMACTESGDLLLAQQVVNQVARLDGTTGESLGYFGSGDHFSTPTGIVRAPWGNFLVTQVGSFRIEEIDGRTGEWVRTFATMGSGEYPFSLAWGPDGNLHVAVGWSPGAGGVVVLDQGGERLGRFGSYAWGRGVAPGPDGRVFASDVYPGPNEGSIRTFARDAETGVWVQQEPTFPVSAHGVRVGADGHLYAAGEDGCVHVLDTTSGAQLARWCASPALGALGELFFGSDAGPCPVPHEGPVASWGFDEAGGTAVLDGSGFGHDGVIVGAVERVAGLVGGALRLDGAGGFVRVPDAPGLAPSAAMTVAALVRPGAPGGAQAIVSKWNDGAGQWSYILKEQGSTWRIELSRRTHHDLADLSSTSTVPFGAWVHVAATFDGLTARLYVDGREEAQAFAFGAIAPSAEDLLIGAVNLDAATGTASEFFRGDIDEVRLYDRALAPAELAALADVVPPITTAALAGTAGTNGWWRSPVTVALSAADAGSGVAEIRYRVDGGAEVVVAGSVASVTVSANGGHTVTYFAVDAAGHQEAPQSLRLSIDRNAPVVLVSVVPSSLKANGKPQEVLVAGGAADVPSGVASVQITVTNRAGKPVASLSAFNRKVTLVGTKGELYTVTAVVADRAGNVARELLDRGIEVMSRGKKTLAEEMSEAYKDVSDVVRVMDRAGVSRLVARLEPMGVVKG